LIKLYAHTLYFKLDTIGHIDDLAKNVEQRLGTEVLVFVFYKC